MQFISHENNKPLRGASLIVWRSSRPTPLVLSAFLPETWSQQSEKMWFFIHNIHDLSRISCIWLTVFFQITISYLFISHDISSYLMISHDISTYLNISHIPMFNLPMVPFWSIFQVLFFLPGSSPKRPRRAFQDDTEHGGGIEFLFGQHLHDAGTEASGVCIPTDPHRWVYHKTDPHGNRTDPHGEIYGPSED